MGKLAFLYTIAVVFNAHVVISKPDSMTREVSTPEGLLPTVLENGYHGLEHKRQRRKLQGQREPRHLAHKLTRQKSRSAREQTGTSCSNWVPTLNITSNPEKKNLTVNYCISGSPFIPSTWLCVIGVQSTRCVDVEEPVCTYTFDNISTGYYTIQITAICFDCYESIYLNLDCSAPSVNQWILVGSPAHDKKNLSSFKNVSFSKNESLPKYDSLSTNDPSSKNDNSDSVLIFGVCCAVFICGLIAVLATRHKKTASASVTIKPTGQRLPEYSNDPHDTQESCLPPSPVSLTNISSGQREDSHDTLEEHSQVLTRSSEKTTSPSLTMKTKSQSLLKTVNDPHVTQESCLSSSSGSSPLEDSHDSKGTLKEYFNDVKVLPKPPDFYRQPKPILFPIPYDLILRRNSLSHTGLEAREDNHQALTTMRSVFTNTQNKLQNEAKVLKQTAAFVRESEISLKWIDKVDD